MSLNFGRRIWTLDLGRLERGERHHYNRSIGALTSDQYCTSLPDGPTSHSWSKLHYSALLRPAQTTSAARTRSRSSMAVDRATAYVIGRGNSRVAGGLKCVAFSGNATDQCVASHECDRSISTAPLNDLHAHRIATSVRRLPASVRALPAAVQWLPAAVRLCRQLHARLLRHPHVNMRHLQHWRKQQRPWASSNQVQRFLQPVRFKLLLAMRPDDARALVVDTRMTLCRRDQKRSAPRLARSVLL